MKKLLLVLCFLMTTVEAEANGVSVPYIPTPVSVANGGTGLSSVSAHQVATGTASNTYTAKTLPDCQDSTGNHLNYTQSSDVWSCGTSTGPGGGPQFRINRTANQTGVASVTDTKVAFDTSVYDTSSICDVVTNNRCTPTTAGKYHVILQINYSGTLSVGGADKCEIKKNGTTDTQNVSAQIISSTNTVICAADINMNGSTDYVEGWIFLTTTASTGTVTGDPTQTVMSGFLE